MNLIFIFKRIRNLFLSKRNNLIYLNYFKILIIFHLMEKLYPPNDNINDLMARYKVPKKKQKIV